MKTILIGIIFWLTTGCAVVKEIGGDLSHLVKPETYAKMASPMTPRVENGRVLSTEEAAWDRDKLLYSSGQKDIDELNERMFWGDPLVAGGTSPSDPFANRSFEEQIASPNTIIRNTSGAFYPIGGRGYYRYGGRLCRIPPRNTIEYDWYLRRKAWGDFK